MDRTKIDDQYKWDLTQIFKNNEEFEETYNQVKKEIEDFAKYEEIMLKDANNLYRTLTTYNDINRKLEKLYVYTSFLFDIDTSNNQNQALKMKMSNLYNDWTKTSFFVTPTILKKDYKEIEEYYKEEPKLLEYEIILKREFRYKNHTLSDAEERLISSVTKALGNDYQTYTLLKDSDLTFGNVTNEEGQEVELTSSNYSLFIESKNRSVRKDAFQTLYKTYKQFANTFASIISGSIKENVTLAKIRKFNSTRESCLYADELDTSIYDNLIDTVNNNMNIISTLAIKSLKDNQ